MKKLDPRKLLNLSLLKSKKILIAIPVVIILIVTGLLFHFTNKNSRSVYLDSEDVPLSDGTVAADFYLLIETAGSNAIYSKYVGSGRIAEAASSVSDDPALIESVLRVEPDIASYVDYYHEIQWYSLYKSSKKNIVLGKVVNSDHDPIFASIKDLKDADIHAGYYVVTEGYYSPNDGGAAYYYITDKPSSSADDIFVIAMNNGHYAQLVLDSAELFNVAWAGIMPETNIADALNSLCAKVPGRASGLLFNSGTYYIDKRVFLSSLAYYGNDTTLKVSPNFSSDFFGAITTAGDKGPYNIEFYDLIFHYPTSSGNARNGQESGLVYLQNVLNCTVDNCLFIADTPDKSAGHTAVDLLWVKSSKLDNFKVTNSTFENHCGYAYTGAYTDDTHGGCIWVSGSNSTADYFDNIYINRCEFETTVSDEIIAVWKGTYNKVHVDDCLMTLAEGHYSDNIVALYNGSFNDAQITKCDFDLYSRTTRPVKIMQLTSGSNFTIDDCYFNSYFDTSLGNGVEFILLATDSDNYGGATTLNVTNNHFNSLENSFFSYAVTLRKVSDKNVVLLNNICAANLTAAFLNSDNTADSAFTAKKNHVYNSVYLNSISNNTNVSYLYDDNEITNSISSWVANTCDIDYTFQNNRSDHGGSSLFQSNSIVQDTSRINIQFNGNDLSKHPRSYLSSSNGASEEAVISVTE